MKPLNIDRDNLQIFIDIDEILTERANEIVKHITNGRPDYCESYDLDEDSVCIRWSEHCRSYNYDEEIDLPLEAFLGDYEAYFKEEKEKKEKEEKEAYEKVKAEEKIKHDEQQLKTYFELAKKFKGKVLTSDDKWSNFTEKDT